MEIVKEIVEYNQTAMIWAKLIPVILGIILLILLIWSIIEVIKQNNRQTKGEKIKKISILLAIYIVGMTIMTFGTYAVFKINGQYTSAKVEGEAVFQKYEDANEQLVEAKLKGKNNQTIYIRLDKAELLNQKERIVRGDKVQIESDKDYPLTKIDDGTINEIKKGFDRDNREKVYELKKGSELVKVD